MKNSIKTFHTVFGITILSITITTLSGCKKLVETTSPITAVTSANAYGEDKLAASVITGIYSDMSNVYISIPNNLTAYSSIYPALMADELEVNGVLNSSYIPYYTNRLDSRSVASPWEGIYSKIIYRANAAIEGLTASNTLTPALKQQLLGDAFFLRAFAYFYLVNLFGDVPLILNTDYKANSTVSRTDVKTVNAQIISDLLNARDLLAAEYKTPDAITTTNNSRITPNKAAAQALLARAYLFDENYPAAEKAASEVIDQNGRYGLTVLSSVFQANSNESIWHLQPVQTGYNTQDAQVLLIPPTGPDYAHPITLSSPLNQAFEPFDQRKTAWIDSVKIGNNVYRYVAKYKVAAYNAPVTEYKTVLRLAEVFLIRAEARAQQGNDLNGAQSDLNKVRSRAGLPGTAANTKSSLISAIIHERQVELFLEWGDRWFTLKRTKTIDQVMPAVCMQKGTSWDSFRQLLPLPISDLNSNRSLTQNPGYN